MKHVRLFEQFVNEAKNSSVNEGRKLEDLIDFDRHTNYMPKNAADKEFLSIIRDILNDIGIGRVTDLKMSGHNSGRTIGIQLDGHLNIFYKSAWRGLSGDKYPPTLSVQDETGKQIKLDPNDTFGKLILGDKANKGGTKNYKWNAKGKKDMKAYLLSL